MARPIIEASQKNKDNLLQILLYKEYQQYVKNTHNDNIYPEDMDIGTKKYIVLSFDEWLEKILEEF
jgi:hypothetical protein